MNKPQITPDMKISELLKEYPELEDKLIEIAPTFKKLKNPVLRKTLTKVTSLKQASTVGGVSLAEMINRLRNEAGQNKLDVESTKKSNQIRPEWVQEEKIKISYDASLDLEGGQHPVGKVSKEILSLENDDIYLLVTPFIPGPLIDIVEEKGFVTFSETINESEARTYIKRS